MRVSFAPGQRFDGRTGNGKDCTTGCVSDFTIFFIQMDRELNTAAHDSLKPVDAPAIIIDQSRF
jgi:hypothetical protein